MRVLIASDSRIDADVICTSARHAKKVLNEQRITTLFVSQKIDGRERGLDVLRWAEARGKLPRQITLVDPSPAACVEIGNFLKAKGYRAFDARQYIRLLH